MLHKPCTMLSMNLGPFNQLIPFTIHLPFSFLPTTLSNTVRCHN